MRYRYDELLSRLPEAVPLVGAEIGVASGGMSAQLLLGRPLLTLYMVDIDFKGAGDSTKFAAGRAKIIKGRSPDVASQFPGWFFDFVFIDADHSFEAVCRDIEAWLPKVKAGGLICGHDYGYDEGVALAVNRYFTEPELGGDTTWFIRLQ